MYTDRAGHGGRGLGDIFQSVCRRGLRQRGTTVDDC